MPSKKIVSDQYTIRAPEVIIDGNLIVGGSQTSLTVQNTSIQDRVIVLNQGENGPGGGVPGITGGDGTSGIEIDRGASGEDNAYLKFRETDDAWILDNGDGTARYILTSVGSSAGSGLTAVVEDTAPTLGGNLELDGFQITQTSSNVQVYIDSVGSGGSGIFVNNNIDAAQELIVKKKAVIYALIF